MFIINCIAHRACDWLKKFLSNAMCFKNKSKTFAVIDLKITEEYCWYINKTALVPNAKC